MEPGQDADGATPVEPSPAQAHPEPQRPNPAIEMKTIIGSGHRPNEADGQ